MAEPVDESKKRFREFDCPECTANNPLDDAFSVGQEVQCNYCGLEFRVLPHGHSFKLVEVS